MTVNVRRLIPKCNSTLSDIVVERTLVKVPLDLLSRTSSSGTFRLVLVNVNSKVPILLSGVNVRAQVMLRSTS